jgi:hypothetical protein
MPALPFVAVILGYFISRIDTEFDVYRKTGLIIILVAAGVFSLATLAPGDMPERNSLVEEGWHPTVETASRWMGENYPDRRVFTSFRYPPIGYYSKLETVKVPNHLNYSQVNMTNGDIVYYTEESTLPYPNKEYLDRNADFRLLKSFDETVYIYEYRE